MASRLLMVFCVAAVVILAACAEDQQAAQGPTATAHGTATAPATPAGPTHTPPAVRPRATPTPTLTPALHEKLLPLPDRVKVPLNAEMARYHAEGLALVDLFHGSLDGQNEHLAAVYQGFEGARERGYSRVMAIYELQDSELVSLWARTDLYLGDVTIDGQDVLAESANGEADRTLLSGKDLNSDGLNDVVFHIWRGGHCFDSVWIEMYTVQGHEVVPIEIRSPAGSVPIDLLDIDDNGMWEVIAFDTRWESHIGKYQVNWGCHWCAPTPKLVLKWDGTRYVEASSEFPQYYERVVAELERRAAIAVSEPRTPVSESQALDLDAGRMSLAVSLLVNYVYMGDSEKGRARYLAVADPDRFFTEEWRAHLNDLNCELMWILDVPLPCDGDT